jgi:hypothetical protein
MCARFINSSELNAMSTCADTKLSGTIPKTRSGGKERMNEQSKNSGERIRGTLLFYKSQCELDFDTKRIQGVYQIQ